MESGNVEKAMQINKQDVGSLARKWCCRGKETTASRSGAPTRMRAEERTNGRGPGPEVRRWDVIETEQSG